MSSSSRSEIMRLVRFIKPRRKSYLFGLFGFSIIDSSLPISMAISLKFVLDAVANKSMSGLWIITIILVAITVVYCILIPTFQYAFSKSVKWIMTDFRLAVFHHLEKLPVVYYEDTHSGDSLSRITNDLGVMENTFTDNIRSLISLVITGVISAVAMFYLDWRFAVVMIVMGLVSTYVNSRFAKPLRKVSDEIQLNSSKQLERLSDLIAGTQVSRMFQMIDTMNEKYRATNYLLAKLSINRTVKNAYLKSTNYFLLWINNGGAFILGTLLMINGQMTLGTLFALILLLEHVTNLFRQLGNVWSALQSSLAGASRVFELLDYDEEPERYTAATINLGGEEEEVIEFQNGSFSYEDGEQVLDGLSFKVKRGQVIALVGPSGGGKSTIIKLLLGFYPLHQGEIRIKGRRYGDYNLSEIREEIAYVSQDAYLFEGTIEENIRLGKTDASYEEVIAAARAAYAHDFIMEQVDGYSTLVGERGARLSGGQKQRITIARALLKNSPILLLDEATSALDSESEHAVQQGLQQLMQGKTTIAIAHRLSTIEQADMIYVIDKGKIVEQGTHDTLLEAGGMYSQLLHMQERNVELKQSVS